MRILVRMRESNGRSNLSVKKQQLRFTTESHNCHEYWIFNSTKSLEKHVKSDIRTSQCNFCQKERKKKQSKKP
jgi:hypothetical protein